MCFRFVHPNYSPAETAQRLPSEFSPHNPMDFEVFQAGWERGPLPALWEHGVAPSDSSRWAFSWPGPRPPRVCRGHPRGSVSEQLPSLPLYQAPWLPQTPRSVPSTQDCTRKKLQQLEGSSSWGLWSSAADVPGLLTLWLQIFCLLLSRREVTLALLLHVGPKAFLNHGDILVPHMAASISLPRAFAHPSSAPECPPHPPLRIPPVTGYPRDPVGLFLMWLPLRATESVGMGGGGWR